jgi:hypothetical protein
MMTALAAGAKVVEGYWYPDALTQILLLFGFTVFFTFLGNFWFALGCKRRSLKSWMTGAFKASIAWIGFIFLAVVFPIAVYNQGVTLLQNKTVGGVLFTPFLTESLVGAGAFGLCIALIIGYVALFYTKNFRWFLKA